MLQRIADAPRAYVLTERPRRVARHAALVARWRRRGRDRYLVGVLPPTRHDPRISLEVVAPVTELNSSAHAPRVQMVQLPRPVAARVVVLRVHAGEVVGGRHQVCVGRVRVHPDF